jgi:hypothetical protein
MDRKERIEENEKLFREVNERVADMQASFQSGPDPEWICECGDETCFEKLSIPLTEYRDVRAHKAWFVIVPGHEIPDVERIVSEHGRYDVVEKGGLT